MKVPKITLRADLPFIEMVRGRSGNVIFAFNPPKVTFDVADDYSAYDYCTATGYANFPLMYRESKTGYPVFHNSFWNQDIEISGTVEGVTYEVSTGYDASKSDAENLPYVAVHCQNRPQIYASYFSQSPTNDDILKVTNYDDFEVSFDYKFDGFGTDPNVSYKYSFLYYQGASVSDYQSGTVYIAETDEGSVIFCGQAPSYVDIDPATGETTNTGVYISEVLNIDWTQWHRIKFVTAYKNDITGSKKSAVYLYVDDALIELHALNTNLNRTDGGINTNYALSVYFNCLSTRNAFYTGDYWIKNYQIKNRKPEYSGCKWKIAKGSGYVYSDENTFDLDRVSSGGDPDAFFNVCDYLDVYNNQLYEFSAKRIKTPEFDLNLQAEYDNLTRYYVLSINVPYCTEDLQLQESEFKLTDLSTSNTLSQQFICYPLSEDLSSYSQGWTSYPYASLTVTIDNPVFVGGWCVLSADQNVNLGFQQYSPQSQQYSIEFYLRLTEANISGMNDIARIMYLFKTNNGTGKYRGSAKTYYLGFKAENNVAHNVLGYFVVYYIDSSSNVTIMSKFPYFKGTEIYHIACIYPQTYTAGRVIYINGSPVFNFPGLTSSDAVQVIPDTSNQGALFNNGSAVGFNCAIRGFRVCKMFVYTPYLNTDNVFFTCVDTINYSDRFNESDLQSTDYWDRVTAVMNNKQFDPFTLYPDFTYPETVSLANPEIRWTNETTGQYLGVSPITTNVTRNSVIKGIPHYPDFMGVNSVVIPEDVYMQFNIERQVPPTAVITTDSLVVYKGTYVTLSGADSYDDITSYEWSNGSEAEEIQVLITETQTFTLKVTNAYGTDTASVQIKCKDTPVIDKSLDLVNVSVDALEIPLSAIPYQELYIILNNQNCYITLRQLGDYIYASLRVDNNVIFSNVICNINAPLNVYPSPYFTGILQFYDEKGTDKPHYSELGSRWKLKYRASRLTGEVY